MTGTSYEATGWDTEEYSRLMVKPLDQRKEASKMEIAKMGGFVQGFFADLTKKHCDVYLFYMLAYVSYMLAKLACITYFANI